MKKTIFLASSLVLLSTFAMAKEVTIGLPMPVTGPIAAYGQTAYEGVKFANMLEPTLKNGDPIRIVLVDTKGDKVETTTATRRLIASDKVVGIIGALTTGNTQQVLSIAEEKKIPVIAPAATADKLLNGKKFGARVAFMDSFQGTALASFAIKDLNAKSAVIIIDQAQVYSLGLAKNFEKKFTELDGKVLKKLSISSGDKDFKAIAAQLKELNADIVYIPVYHPEASMIARQARQAGVTSLLASGDGVSNSTFIELGGESVNGYLYTDTFDYTQPPTQRSKDFLDAFEKDKGRRDIPGFTAQGADAYFIMVKAMNECADPTDSVCVNEKIHQTKDFDGVSGIISIDESGNAIRSVVIKEIKNLKPTYKGTVNP
ncbi:MAG: ABC transporter substrate-binding protein [Campylobacter sp.]|nr:ABC transporter substrate-binding protein [Campylobacter sp.]